MAVGFRIEEKRIDAHVFFLLVLLMLFLLLPTSCLYCCCSYYHRFSVVGYFRLRVFPPFHLSLAHKFRPRLDCIQIHSSCIYSLFFVYLPVLINSVLLSPVNSLLPSPTNVLFYVITHDKLVSSLVTVNISVITVTVFSVFLFLL